MKFNRVNNWEQLRHIAISGFVVSEPWVVELANNYYWCPGGGGGGVEGVFFVERLAVFPLPPPLLSTVYQCDRCLSSRGIGAHGWVVRFCQPSMQSPSWSSLPNYC